MQVILVTYKTQAKEIDRLKSEIKNLNFVNYAISVIDNSTNGKGFAWGVNQGINEGLKNKADYFLILNPDVSLQKLKGQDILSCGKSFDICGFAMRQGGVTYYGGEIDKWRMSGGLIKKKPVNRYEAVDFVSGSLMLIKREVIRKIGLFNEDYHMYYEDVEYCLRAKRAGFKVGIDCDLSYRHFENSRNNPEKDQLLSKNRQRFLWKYGSPSQKIYEVIKNLSQRRFLINFFSLNVSSFLNKFFNFILFIFLVRYFSAKDYGTYNLVWGYIGFFAPFIDFGTTSYGLVYLPNEKNEHLTILNSLRFILSIIIFTAAMAGAYLFHFEKSFFFYVFLISFTVFTNMWSGSYLIINSLKQKLFNSSIVSIIFNFLLTAALIFGVIKYRNLQLLFITIGVAYVIYALINYFLVNKEIGKTGFIFDAKEWVKIIKKSYIFVLIGFSAGLYFKQDIFLLNYFKSSNEVGVYSAGYKFFEAFLFLAAGYNITVTPIFAKLVNEPGNLRKKIKKDFVFLSFLGLAVSVSFYFLGPLVLPLFLKSNYLLSIQIARIVIFALPFILLSSIFFNLLYVRGKPFLVLAIFAFQIILNFILNIIFIPKFSYFASAYITVFSEFVNFSLSYLFVRKFLK